MDITTEEYKGYSEFKSTLDREISNVATGFVRIGYMLKVARDTNVLSESGYKSVAEFAQAEYGLSKDVVSRYIAINDRYSDNGYSYELTEQYRAYGYAKLAEMLTLPAEVVEVLDNSLTKEEIRVIKTEIKEEQKITDLEVMMENPEPSEMSLSEMALRKYMEDDMDTFTACSRISDMVFDDKTVETMLDALAPSGIAMHVVRIPGTGRLIMSIRGKDRSVETVNARTGEKDTRGWEEIFGLIKDIFDVSAQYCMDQYCEIYGHEPKPKEEKQEVAPAQPHWPAKEIPDKKKKAAAQKKSKVTVPKKPEKTEKIQVKQPESLVFTPCGGDAEKQPKQTTEDIQKDIKTEYAEEEQIPGQMEVADYPELLPEGQQAKPQESEESVSAVSVEPDKAAGLLSEQELRNLWQDIEERFRKVEEFVEEYYQSDIVDGLESLEEVKTAYEHAISLAAGMEKLMIEKRRREKSDE